MERDYSSKRRYTGIQLTSQRVAYITDPSKPLWTKAFLHAHRIALKNPLKGGRLGKELSDELYNFSKKPQKK